MPKIQAYVQNTDLGDLFVTVRDLNAAGSPVIFKDERVNEDDNYSFEAEADGGGDGKIDWEVRRTDNPNKSGTKSNVTFTDGETIDVYTQ